MTGKLYCLTFAGARRIASDGYRNRRGQSVWAIASALLINRGTLTRGHERKR